MERPRKDRRGITKRDSRPDGYKEWGVRVYGDAVLLDFWCRYAEILFEVVVLRFPELRNFRVILMWFAVFSCYSVPCLYAFLRGFEVFVSPLRPPW